jgi:5-methyltetrahydrofolate--homocysteine methyltransferase
MTEQHRLTQVIVDGKRKEVAQLVQACLDAGEKADFIVEQRLVPGMAIVGEKFKCNEIFVPEMMMAARAMKEALGILEPRLIAAGVTPKHTAVIGTVQGDLHDIGKNLVAMMWKGANIRVIDLGVNAYCPKTRVSARSCPKSGCSVQGFWRAAAKALAKGATEIRSCGDEPTSIVAHLPGRLAQPQPTERHRIPPGGGQSPEGTTGQKAQVQR